MKASQRKGPESEAEVKSRRHLVFCIGAVVIVVMITAINFALMFLC